MPLPDGSPARIMVITAHPVDAFDNSGGTCAEHIAQGDHVIAVICTSGINIHNERLFDELRKPEAERDPEVLTESSGDYAARKKKEAEDSLGCFGITDVIVLPHEGIEGHCGIFSGTSYAEAFVRLKVPVFDTLPINQKHHADLQISSAENTKNNHQVLGAFVKEADGSWAWGVEAEKI